MLLQTQHYTTSWLNFAYSLENLLWLCFHFSAFLLNLCAAATAAAVFFFLTELSGFPLAPHRSPPFVIPCCVITTADDT